MSQARRTWEVVYRAVITSLQLLDDYRTVMGIENGSGRALSRDLAAPSTNRPLLSCRPHRARTRVRSMISIGAVS